MNSKRIARKNQNPSQQDNRHYSLLKNIIKIHEKCMQNSRWWHKKEMRLKICDSKKCLRHCVINHNMQQILLTLFHYFIILFLYCNSRNKERLVIFKAIICLVDKLSTLLCYKKKGLTFHPHPQFVNTECLAFRNVKNYV